MTYFMLYFVNHKKRGHEDVGLEFPALLVQRGTEPPNVGAKSFEITAPLALFASFVKKKTQQQQQACEEKPEKTFLSVPSLTLFGKGHITVIIMKCN